MNDNLLLLTVGFCAGVLVLVLEKLTNKKPNNKPKEPFFEVVDEKPGMIDLFTGQRVETEEDSFSGMTRRSRKQK